MKPGLKLPETRLVMLHHRFIEFRWVSVHNENNVG